MNFRQFEALYWIARLGSFHAAARHLETSQPAVSARIRELEQELGVAVFDRSGRKVKLTAKGHELTHYAAQVMAIASEIRQRIGTKEALAGHVRLGVPGIAAMTWLPALLDRAARTYPGLTVEFTVDSSEILCDMLERGGLEVAVMARPPSVQAVTTEPLGQVQMVWLCSPSLVLPSHPVSAAELAVWPVITDRNGSHLHGVAMEWFRSEGVEPARHHGCSNLPTRIHLALTGMGVALASPLAASRELADGRLRQVATVRPAPALEYVIAYADIGLSPAGRLIAEMAKGLILQRPDFQSYYGSTEVDGGRAGVDVRAPIGGDCRASLREARNDIRRVIIGPDRDFLSV